MYEKQIDASCSVHRCWHRSSRPELYVAKSSWPGGGESPLYESAAFSGAARDRPRAPDDPARKGHADAEQLGRRGAAESACVPVVERSSSRCYQRGRDGVSRADWTSCDV